MDEASLKEAIERTEKSTNRANNGGCVEVAIDVDNFTYNIQQRRQCHGWALAQIRRVCDLHPRTAVCSCRPPTFTSSEHTPCPTSPTMPVACWTTFGRLGKHPSLDAVQRDVTHLMSSVATQAQVALPTSRELLLVCLRVQRLMTSSTTTNINSYSWNLDVVSHELGHNFG